MENLEVSNLLIVESENDKYFIEAFIKYLNLTIEVDEAICSIDEYECLGGMSKLNNKLIALESNIEKNGIDKIGIIFDADDVGIQKRTEKINSEIDSVFKNKPDIFSIYIMNVDGKGELETVLKKISSEDSTMADCLEKWQKCLESNDKKIRQKDFDKFWVQVYQRYDCCAKKEAKQAGEKCDNEASFKKNIWNFEDVILKELKVFLEELSK